MSFEIMCFVAVIIMGVAIAIYGFIKVNGGVQPKMAAKQAPPSYNPPPPRAMPTSFKVPNNFHAPTYNTSSLGSRPNLIGKPLVIKNWDRLAGMMIPIITNPNFNGHDWIVTQAGESRDGYSCMFENGGGFGTSNKAVSLNVYSDMYDSHRVLVKCGGRITTMDVETFKDPNNMLYKIAMEFQEKFR